MSQYSNILEDYKGICEASHCNEEAITQINVNVGKFGTIKLNLCYNCTSKFSENKKETKLQQSF